MALECEEKSGKVTTPYSTHPITGVGKDMCHIGVMTAIIILPAARQFSNPLDF